MWGEIVDGTVGIDLHAAHEHQVALGRQYGILIDGMTCWLGVVQREVGRCLGYVDGKHVQPPVVVAPAEEIDAPCPSVDVDMIAVVDVPPFARRRYAAVDGQQGELGAGNAADGNVALLVLDGDEIDVRGLRVVRQEEVPALCLNQAGQRLPLVEQRHSERLTTQAVHDDGVQQNSVVVSLAKDDGVVLGYTQHIGSRTML